MKKFFVLGMLALSSCSQGNSDDISNVILGNLASKEVAKKLSGDFPDVYFKFIEEIKFNIDEGDLKRADSVNKFLDLSSNWIKAHSLEISLSPDEPLAEFAKTRAYIARGLSSKPAVCSAFLLGPSAEVGEAGNELVLAEHIEPSAHMMAMQIRAVKAGIMTPFRRSPEDHELAAKNVVAEMKRNSPLSYKIMTSGALATSGENDKCSFVIGWTTAQSTVEANIAAAAVSREFLILSSEKTQKTKL
jgi:hypothetical protein